ncbi:hypothetical protein Poli38472_005708 [Pythium oligandrum]|uniref:Uncharacterized protein n=1 Tax=Pythium oligandrum TaxID=41045 RepID=A0A8K1CT60_PYTOL|nr:hypothetical protein Poli38472_005708 [Pythium oligandrum]|eukprot:TMW68240.1 hypothetical protein Poli38472_005708 [Pythium oligandrum]
MPQTKMTQDGALITGGLTIRRPTRRASAAETDFVCATQDSVDSANEDTDEEASQSHRDEETHTALQEMAFHHAMEQARSVVRTILLKANQHRYHQVHEFFQRYMHSVCRKGQNTMADHPFELKVTAFPGLTKLPAVAIVSGSDATFSDVWMTPVCQVINRSFPLVVVIPGDTTDVRQLVEFLTERMDDYSVVREREEKWLLEQIEQWGELDKLDGPDQQENKSAENELSQFRSSRRRWTVGWKCFRAAVAWYRLEKRAETFVESMAVALDGKIREAKLVEWIVTMLEVHPWELILHVLEEWSVFIAPLNDQGLAQEVQDLIELCQHVLETYREEETAEMRPVLRKEVSQFFRTRIVSLMESVEIDPKCIGGMISQWTTPSATVEAWRRLQLTQFESMKGLLQNPKRRREPSWAGDVSRAFQYYDDHIGLYMNLTSWFEAFVEATQKDVDVSSDVMVTLTARFTRAIATLREWGYIAGPDGVLRRFMRNDSRGLVVEKLLFL